MVELLRDKDNRWYGIVRQAPERWTTKEWRKVYGFAKEGQGMALRTDRFIDGRFSGRVNPKDGYVVVDCKEPRARRVLEFMVPLLYPEKPTRVTITVGNTIFGALSGEKPVDWRVVVKDLVQRLLSGMGRRQRLSAPMSSTCINCMSCCSRLRRKSTGSRRHSSNTMWNREERRTRRTRKTRKRRRARMTRNAKVSLLGRFKKFKSKRLLG